jgi:hypothetical protein
MWRIIVCRILDAASDFRNPLGSGKMAWFFTTQVVGGGHAFTAFGLHRGQFERAIAAANDEFAFVA